MRERYMKRQRERRSDSYTMRGRAGVHAHLHSRKQEARPQRPPQRAGVLRSAAGRPQVHDTPHQRDEAVVSVATTTLRALLQKLGVVEIVHRDRCNGV